MREGHRGHLGGVGSRIHVRQLENSGTEGKATPHIWWEWLVNVLFIFLSIIVKFSYNPVRQVMVACFTVHLLRGIFTKTETRGLLHMMKWTQFRRGIATSFRDGREGSSSHRGHRGCWSDCLQPPLSGCPLVSLVWVWPSFKGGFRLCLWRGPATYPPPARHPGGHGRSRRSRYGAPGLRLAPYQVSYSVKATWNRLRKMWKRKSQKFHTTAQKIYESNMYLTVTFKGLKHYISRDVVATDDPNVAFKVLKNLKYRK